MAVADAAPSPSRSRARRPALSGCVALVVVLAACTAPVPSVAESLAEACTHARDHLAAAPAPDTDDTEAEFRQAAEEATRAAGRVAGDLAARGDDRTIADLAWQLHRFPRAAGAGAVPAAHQAAAAITRIDSFARLLEIPECGAATWRPAEWRAMAGRHAERPSDDAFLRDLNDLCARTFPDAALLRSGAPLLTALVADPPVRGRAGDIDADDVKDRLITRLRRVSDSPGDTRRFFTAFSNGLPELRPSEHLESHYTALLAAFMDLDSALPRAMPRDPPPDLRERVHAALDGLEDAWEGLGITC
jgi:hypothetical protein